MTARKLLRQADTGRLSFDNRLPPTYPQRLALERAIRSALAGLPGRWDVIVEAPRALPLVVAVVAPDTSAWTCMMNCGKPEDLLPKAIADSVRAVCRRHCEAGDSRLNRSIKGASD
jgi:hypothetical protein